MKSNCLRQLKSLINITSLFTKKRYGQKYDFLSEIAHPLLDREVKLGTKFVHDYLSWD